MGNADHGDNGGVRQLIELATSCGRKHQNEQTGFVHFFYNKEDEKDNAAIPVYENLLFALSLMRSKSTDTVLEGKAIVEKILPFQNHVEEIGKGSFPIYLHEYPHCKDRLLGIRLLPVFFSILDQFHHVIGAALKNKLIDASRKLLNQCLHTHREKAVPYSLVFTLGILSQALGKFVNEENAIAEGKNILETLKRPQEEFSWYTPAGLSEIIIALQSGTGISLPDGWENFWQYLVDTWHKKSCSFVGPGWREYQMGQEPQATLYDLYMGFARGSYSYRAFVDHPFQLQGSLIHLTPLQLPQNQTQLQGQVSINPWFVFQKEAYGLCLLGKKEPINPSYEKAFNPLKIHWGDRMCTRSFVFQGGNAKEISYEWHPDGYIGMEVTLGDFPNVEDKEKAREVAFFTEAHEDCAISIKNNKATTFTLEDEICVSSGGMTLLLTFSLAEGDGNFVGHIMRGNRPSQINLKGENRLNAFDWQIFLRTIYRTTPCKVKINIQLKEG